MKTNVLKLAAILLVLAGGFACERGEAIDNIDFSNIENLYAQPLPVIQKAIQGKWKVYQTCGGIVGCVYPDSHYVTFTANEIISDINTDEQYVFPYSWKKKKVDIYGEKADSYVMWTDNADETAQAGEYFFSIKNDTLSSRSCSLTSDYTVFSQVYVRVK